MIDPVHQCAEAFGCYRDAVADVVGETGAGRIAVLDRREHRAAEQQNAVRILVMSAHRMADKLKRVAADARHRARAFERKAVIALHMQLDDRIAHIVDAEMFVEQPDERTDGA